MSLRVTIAVLTLSLTPLPAAQAADPENRYQSTEFRGAMPQSQTAGVSAREIVQPSLRFETLFGLFDLHLPPDYLCLVEMAGRSVDASVQPAHIGSAWEVMSLYGETFLRLTRRHGEELAPDKARAEQARFDKSVEKRAHETLKPRRNGIKRNGDFRRTATLAGRSS